MHVVHADILAEAGERPAHAEQRQKGGNGVEVLEGFLLVLMNDRGLLHEMSRQLPAERFYLDGIDVAVLVGLQGHQNVALNQKHRRCLAKGVNQSQNAQIAHFMLHESQIDGNEEFGVAPEDSKLAAVKSNNGIFADFRRRHRRLGRVLISDYCGFV